MIKKLYNKYRISKIRILDLSRLGLFIIMASCAIISEERLEDETINLLSPPDGHETDIANQTFWWDEIAAATQYRIQIVSYSFQSDSLIRLVTDTLIKNNKMEFTLEPDKYEWRVRAENSSYETSFSDPRSLIIDSTSNLSRQTVILISPVNNTIVADTTVKFEWQSLYNADEYFIQVVKNYPFNGSELLEDQQTVYTNSYTHTFSDAKKTTYYWRVRGQNVMGNSDFSSIFAVEVDTSSG